MRGLCFIYCYTSCSVTWPKSDGPSFSLDTVSKTCIDDYNNDAMVYWLIVTPLPVVIITVGIRFNDYGVKDTCGNLL